MDKPQKKKLKILVLFLVLFLLGFLCVFMASTIISNVTQRTSSECYKQVALKLNVEPNYDSISSEINSILNTSLSFEMHRDQVLEIMETIAPVRIVESDQLANGLVRELIEIQICPDYQDNIKLIVDYQNGSEFVEFVVFLDD